MDIRYTADHEWVTVDGGGIATVGITDHAQGALGDLVFVQLPDLGASLTKGAPAAVVESVKAASDILAPLAGTVVGVNTAAISDPTLINADPQGGGWLFKIQLSDAAELESLLDESAYRKVTT